MNRLEFARMRNELALLAPQAVDIELTNLCNLRCRFCPRDALTRAKGTMSEATFLAVLDRLPLQAEIYFCGIGEPLLHERAVEFVRRAKRQAKGRVVLVTNAALLTAATSRRLLDAGLDGVQVSFNGLSPRVYEQVMVGGRFATALANVDAALAVWAGRVGVQILVTETRLNRAEIAGLQSFWRGRGVDEVLVTPCHSRAGFLHDDALYDLRPPPPLPVCGIFATITFVAWTGEVLACCQDLPGACVIGDLTTDDFATIVERKRQVVRTGRWFPMCRACESERRYTILGLAPPGSAPPSDAADPSGERGVS